MTQKIKLTIPNPCHENWNTMTPEEKGRFCGMCQKIVYDFTQATDKQIIEAHNKNSQLCGRFLKTQLDRDLILPKERKSIWLASIFFGMISLANSKIQAQEKPNTEQTEIKPKELIGKISNDTIKENIISGIVSDSQGPLPGVNVLVKGTTRGVSTGFKGEYSIQANEGEILVFSFMGMSDVEKIVNKSTIINTTLEDNLQIRLGVIITHKRPSIFKRTYYKIRNLFR